jgi:hypothetical protein
VLSRLYLSGVCTLTPKREQETRKDKEHQVKPVLLRAGADKSLARPGRKQATATKLAFSCRGEKGEKNYDSSRLDVVEIARVA